MVRVRKKCISLTGQKTDSHRQKGDFSPLTPQTRREPKRAKDFQGKLSHSSPPVTRSCSLTQYYEKKNHEVSKSNIVNDDVSKSDTLNTTKQELEPKSDSEVEVVTVISWQNKKLKPICDSLQCSTLKSNSKCESKKTVYLPPKSQTVIKKNVESLSCSNKNATVETQSKPELSSELNVLNYKREQTIETITLLEDETQSSVMFPEGCNKVAIEVEIETSIDACASRFMDNSQEKLICQTPHKIRICNQDFLTQSPSSALSSLNSLSISQTPKKAIKSSRKLHPSQVSNQQTSIKSSRPKQSDIIKQVIATNHKIDEYYPIVRRSSRKTKKTIFEEQQLEIEQAVKEEREDGLEVHNFEGKGRGVVTTRSFSRGEFVVEYSGELIDLGEAKLRETLYTQDQNTGCYMYYFKYRNHQYCIDATSESGRLGRLVNHSRINGNLITKTVLVDNKPRLVLLAKDDIPAGEEIMYDYGDRSKESLRHHPWLKC